MKLDKLLKRLKRDLAASPQKAAALGLMVLVALYFWAPLVMKFVGRGQPKTTPASQATVVTAPAVTPVVLQPTSDPARWDRVRDSLAQDQLMLAVAYRPQWQNPFRRLNVDSDSGDAAAEATPELKPQSEPTAIIPDEQGKELVAGITVTSVLIGTRERAAFIRGTTYRVGNTIEIGGENGEPELKLLVTSIDEHGVDVSLAGKTLRLDRPRAKLTPGSHLKAH